MSWVTITGTIFIALMLGAVLFYFGGSSLAQLGSSTGMTVLRDAGYNGINIGIALTIFLIIIAAIAVAYYFLR